MNSPDSIEVRGDQSSNPEDYKRGFGEKFMDFCRRHPLFTTSLVVNLPSLAVAYQANAGSTAVCTEEIKLEAFINDRAVEAAVELRNKKVVVRDEQVIQSVQEAILTEGMNDFTVCADRANGPLGPVIDRIANTDSWIGELEGMPDLDIVVDVSDECRLRPEFEYLCD